MGLGEEHESPYMAQDLKCLHPVPAASFLEVGVRKSRRLRGGNSLGLQSWHKLPENKALPLMNAVMDGPVAISVAAADWALYEHGIFDGCGRDAVVDHAVVLFGYGSQTSIRSSGEETIVKYWNIRNSWGRFWGEDGYIRLLRHASPEEDDAYCGVDTDPGAGLACKPYPDSVSVCGMCGMLYDSVSAHFVPQ